jgi:hypothetical protein
MFLFRMLMIGLFLLILSVTDSVAVVTPQGATMAIIIPEYQKGMGQKARIGKTSANARVGFFQRAKITWQMLRQIQKGWLAAEDPTEGDRLAKSSRTLGIIGISLLAGIIIPYIGSVAFLGALVLGIIAIVQGRSARRLGSKEKTGEKLGYITVGIWLLFLILAVALLYLLLLSWGG